jgi:hypothetical protein
MPALPTDILAKVLEALRTHRNARRAAKLVGVDQSTAWRIAKKHGIALISRAEHMKARRADPAFIAKQAPAARKGASRWLKAQHAKPKFHKKSIEAARRNLKRLNRDPAFRQASSERLKRLYDDPNFCVKQASAARAARNRGFAIAPILYLLGLIGVGAGVLFSGYSQILRSNQTMSNTLASKNDLQGTATTLAASSWLSTDQTLLCPPMIGSNSPSTPSAKCSTAPGAITVGTAFASAVAANLPANYASVSSAGSPVEVGVFAAGSGAKVLDPWGHYYIYCRWENSIGTANAIMVISAGADGKLATTCGSTTAGGDNLFVVWTTAVTQNRAAVWQTTTAGTSVTGAQFGATGTQVNIQTNGNVSIPGTLGVTGATALGTAGLSVTGLTTLTGGLSASTGTFSGNVSGANGSFSGTLSASGTTTLGALSAGTSTLSSLTVTNNGTIGGTLGVTGATTLGALTAGSSTLSSLSVTGTSYLGGNASTSTGVVQIGTSVSASGTSSGLLTVGKAVSNVYPFIVDQYGAVSGGAFTGTTFTGNLVGSQSGGSVAATTLTASSTTTLNSTLGVTGVTTLSAQLNGTSAIFSGNVQAGSFTGTMSLGGGGVTLSGIVPISNGGTGQTSAANALSALFSGAGTVAQMIPGADLVNNSVTTTQLSTTGVAAGTYSSVTVGLDGRVTSGTGSGGMVSTINDGSGDSVSVGTSGISYAIGSSAVGNWSSTGLMIGSSSPALDKLDVYGATAIGTGYAGTTAAPANGLIVQGSVGIGSASPPSTLSIGNDLKSTSDFSTGTYNEAQQAQINNLYTNTASGQFPTMTIYAQAGATANSTSVDTALQVDNLVPSTETYNFGNKIGIRSEANNAGSGTAGAAYGAQLYGFYSGSNTATNVYGSNNLGENTGNGNVGSAFGSFNEAMNVGTGTVTNAFGTENYDYNSSTGTITLAWGTLNRVDNSGAGTIGTAIGEEDQVYNNSTGTMSSAYGISPHVNNLSTGTISAAYGVNAYVSNGAGTMTTAYGIYDYLTNSGTMASWYGFYIPAITGTTPTTAYDLYIADANNNYIAGNVGIGTATPLDTLDINGTGIHLASGTPGSTTNALYNNAGTLTWNGTALSGGTTLSGGLANNVALWTSSTAIGTSNIYQSSSNIGIGTASPSSTLQIGNAINTADITGLTPTQAAINNAPTNTTASTNVPSLLITTQPSAASNSSSTFEGMINDVYVPSSSSVTYGSIYGTYGENNYAGTGNASVVGVYQQTYNNSASATTAQVRGLYNKTYNNSTGTATNLFGVYNQTWNNSTGTTGTAYGIFNDVENGGATGTMTTAYGIKSQLYNYGATANMTTGYGIYDYVQNNSSVAVSNLYGEYISVAGGGTTTNSYGLYIGSMANGTTAYGIYDSSGKNDYFSGNVGIGSAVPVNSLDIGGGDIHLASGTPANTANALYNNAGTLTWNGTALSGGTTLSGGITNNVALWTSATTIGTSNINQTSGNIGIGTPSPTYGLDVYNGSVAVRSSNLFVAFDSANSKYGQINSDGTNFNIAAKSGQDLMLSAPSSTTPILFDVNSAEAMRITGAGYVGIGSSSPAATLDVNGSVQIANGQNLTFNYASNSGIQFYPGTTVNRRASDGSLLLNSGQANIVITPAVYTVFASGNVGIGVTTPGAPLEIRGTSAGYASNAGNLALTTSSSTNGLRFGVYDSNYSWISSFNSLPLYINTGGNNTILNASGGEVGIGTTAPGYPLEVVRSDNATTDIAEFYPNNLTVGVGVWYYGIHSIGSNANNSLKLDSQSGGYVLLQTNGGGSNVGIGITSPQFTLDTLGKIAVGPIDGTGGTNPSEVVFKQANLAQPSYTNDGRGYVNYYADPTGGTYIRSLDLVSGSVNTTSRIKFFTSTSTGGVPTEAMRIDSTGNVGIGNTSPQVTLDATGTIRDAAGADASPYTNGRIFVYGGTGVDTTNWGYLGYGQDANMRVVYSNTSQNHSLIFGTSSASNNTGTFTPELTIDHLGDLTFANANPVFTSGGSWIQFPYGAYFSGGTSYFQTQAQFRAGVHNDSAAYMEFDGGTSGYSYFSGNVGIGVTSPGSTLEVNGHIKSLQTYQTGSVAVNGSGTWQTVTFPTAFTSTPVVTANMSTLVGGYYGFVVIRGSTISTTSFQFIVVTMQNAVDAAGDTISWIAVAQ